jgi:hypothetical protein
MIVGRNPRTPVIGDTVPSSVDRRHSAGIIVDTDAIRYKVYWRTRQHSVALAVEIP